MGYTRLCKRLTIVRAKCAGAIHLTVRRVPGRAWAQLLLEEESCVEWCPDTESSSPSSSSELPGEPEELEPCKGAPLAVTSASSAAILFCA